MRIRITKKGDVCMDQDFRNYEHSVLRRLIAEDNAKQMKKVEDMVKRLISLAEEILRQAGAEI